MLKTLAFGLTFFAFSVTYCQIPTNIPGAPCVNELLVEDFSTDIPPGWEGDFMVVMPPFMEGWNLRMGPTPDWPNTGPNEAFSGDYYVYMETSGPAVLGSIYRINTPEIDLTDVNASIRFRVLMYGANTGSLKVNVLHGPGFTLSENVMTISGEQHDSGSFENWTEAWVDIRQYSGQTIKVEFEGMKTSMNNLGDIAIDLVQVCSEPRVPTLSQWSVILLALLCLIFGTIYINQRTEVLARI